MKHVLKSELLGSSALITKGDDDDPVALVTKSLEDLTKTVENRLKALETKTGEVEKKADTKAIVDRLDAIEKKANRPAGGGKVDKDEARELETKAVNKFLRGGIQALDDVEKKTLTWGTSADGGYTTAPEYSTTIVEKLLQFSPMRAVASVMTIGAQKVYIPLLDTRLTAGWVTETGSRSTSQPAFNQLEIDAYEQAVVVQISQQLLEDFFIDLASYVSGQIAKMFAQGEAVAFLKGDGNGKPTGLLNTPGNYTAVSAKQDGTDIIAQVINAFYTVPGAYASRGSWFMNRKTQGIIRAAADTTTKGTLWSDSLANGTPAMLLGRPVYDAPDMDNLLSTADPVVATYPIAFGDFASAYQIVDRTGIQIMRDDYTGADDGIVKIRARRRVGGKPLLTEAMALVEGAAS